MKDVMVDIETLGRKPGCIILSIGAVEFNPKTGETGSQLYLNINVESCKKIGLHEDPETVAWWKKQSQQAKDHLKDNQFDISFAMVLLQQWFKANKIENIWCQGATFDAPILQEIFDILKMETPWKFWAVRDTRTVYDVCGYDPKLMKREGTYHNALDDCMHQIKCVQRALSIALNN